MSSHLIMLVGVYLVIPGSLLLGLLRSAGITLRTQRPLEQDQPPERDGEQINPEPRRSLSLVKSKIR
jgi:hypothetical protein